VRGKLRDKRADTKRDKTRRELIERHRPTKREKRNAIWLIQQLNEEDYSLEEEEKLLEEPTKK
jgi:hypothetical protein